MRIELDMSKLERISRNIPGAAEKVVQKMAQDTETNIKNDFSPNSPSAPGQPPGVDTGTLKNSILAKAEGKATWVVLVGAFYGVHLEYGTKRMAARPFVLPAVRKTAAAAPKELIKRVVE